MRIDSYLKNLPWSRAIFPELVGELALASAMALLGTLLSDLSDGKCSSSFSACFVTLASPFKESNRCTWRHRPRFWETGAFRKWKKILRIVSFISQRVSRKDTSDKVRHYVDNDTNSFPGCLLSCRLQPGIMGERLMGWTSLFDPSRSNLQDLSLKGCSWLT